MRPNLSSQQNKSLALLQKLLKEASVTPDRSNAQSIIAKTLAPYGFKSYQINKNGIQNLFLIRQGKKNMPHLSFAGHTDIVPPGPLDAWSPPPFSAAIKEGKIYGRGAADMKGGIAAYIAAIQNFLSFHPNFQNTLSLMITGDEEGAATDGTIRILDFLKAQKIQPTACLVGEPTSHRTLGDSIKIGRRGSFHGHLKINGKQGHVAYPAKALNPIPELARLATLLSAHQWDEGNPPFEPTHLEITNLDVPDHASNLIPQSASLTFNIRFNPRHTALSLEKEIKKLLMQHHRLPFTLTCKSNAEAFLTKEHQILTNPLKIALQKNNIHQTELTVNGGTSDARFIKNLCPVIEFGPIGASMHQINEHIALSDLQQLETIYQDFITAFFEANKIN